MQLKKLLDNISMVVLASVAVLLTPYLFSNFYMFPKYRPFSGAEWYNPYEDVSSHIIKANFNAHSKGIFLPQRGTKSTEQIGSIYSANDYDIVGISNNNRISNSPKSDIYIPGYVHGLNIGKVNSLLIGAKQTITPALPWLFSKHHVQHQIARTRTTAEVNALAHPGISGFEPSDMGLFAGVSHLEAGNRVGMQLEYWDAALSAGRLIWMLSNDDARNFDLDRVHARWNLLYTAGPTTEAVYSALRKGSHISVDAYSDACEDNRLVSFIVTDDTLSVSFSDTANRIDIVGQDGLQQHTVVNSNSISYATAKDDTYLRTEVHMDNCVYYLNPIARMRDSGVWLNSSSTPLVNRPMTFYMRLAIASVLCFITFLMYRIRRSQD